MTPELKQYDGQIHHPFTCMVAGPSGSGKSTFVRNLLLRQGTITDVEFDYVFIVIGTEARVNKVLSELQTRYPLKVSLIELLKAYPSRADMMAKFPADLKMALKKKSEQGQKGCVIFDDLMSELSECGLLVDLFTKFSSHYSISTIHITQNVFFKSNGKHGTDNVTIYRNTHVLVLFNNPIDNSVVSTVAKQISPSKFAKLNAMLQEIVQRHRYIVIYGHFDRPNELKFVTDLFAEHPVPHQTVYEFLPEA